MPNSETSSEAGDKWIHSADLHSTLAAMQAVGEGDFRVRLPVENEGIVGELAAALNKIAECNQQFLDDLHQISRDVTYHGHLGTRLSENSGPGAWAAGAQAANALIDALLALTLDATCVLEAVAEGDLTGRVDPPEDRLRPDLPGLKGRMSHAISRLALYTGEVTLLAREAGKDGRPCGTARPPGMSGVWRDVTEAVGMTVDRLSLFAKEIDRVSREIVAEGDLDARIELGDASGLWGDLAGKVNCIISTLSSPVRDITQLATAVSQGDLSKKLYASACGEINDSKRAVNAMVDTLCSLSLEITRVAQEVGCEGQLGGQARVDGMNGAWKCLTVKVNELANTLTVQVRAISEVAHALARGDMSPQITLEAHGEVAELKDGLNLMIEKIGERARTNEWLGTNLDRLSETIKGNRDLVEIAGSILREMAPLVNAQCGAFFLSRTDCHGDPSGWPSSVPDDLTFVAGYGLPGTDAEPYGVIARGLVRQAAQERRRIQLDEIPPDYLKIGSALGESPPASIVVIPVLFEDKLLGIIELASFSKFSDTHLVFFDQFVKTIGVAINSISSSACAAALVEESQQLTSQLQERSEELQRQQAELQRSKEELEKAARLAASSHYKSKFLANMSHELRTPLTSMLIYARLLADDIHGHLAADEVAFATNIHKAGTDLLELIDDILDLSKVEAGRLDIRPKKLSLAELLTYLDTTFRPIAEGSGLDLEVRVSDDAPDELYSDVQRLEQILRNLLSNAIKFTPSGRVSLRVERVSEQEAALEGVGDVVAFAVDDTGIGIPADKLSAIFEAFEQAVDVTGDRSGGTGLGLSICRELAALLDGRVVVESVPGAGSCFTLYVPVVRPDHPTDDDEPRIDEGATRKAELPRPQAIAASEDRHAEDPAEDHPGAGSTAMSPSDNLRPHRTADVPRGKALIVDDDIQLITALTRLLERAGIPTVSALSGEAAIDALERDAEVSLVLVDIMMPGMSGRQVIQRIRAEPRYAHLWIIALSASTVADNAKRALAAGADEYVQKPIAEIDRMIQFIYHLMARDRLSEADRPEWASGPPRTPHVLE